MEFQEWVNENEERLHLLPSEEYDDNGAFSYFAAAAELQIFLRKKTILCDEYEITSFASSS